MIRDQYTRRPDNRAGDLKPVSECGMDYVAASFWWCMAFALAAFWGGVFWLLGAI